MDSKKISKKLKKLPKKSTLKVGDLTFKEFSPTQELSEFSSDEIVAVLGQCLVEGDKEAFQEILEGYIKSKNVTNVSKKFKISRSLIYEAIDPKRNPSLETICKIMKAFGTTRTLVRI